jgi:hypothetical protein
MSDTEVATVTLPNGTIITSSMSPVERHNAVAKSIGAPEVARPAGPIFGPQGLTPATANEYARHDAQAAKAPPTGAPAKPAASTPAEKIAALDAELQAAGIQKTPQTPRAPDGKFVAKPTVADVDASFIDALNKAYRALTPAEREAKRAQYRAELQEGFEGRRLGESRANFLARAAGAPAQVPSEPAAQTYTPKEWKDGHKSVTDEDGWMPIDRVNPAELSGYTLPRLVEGQQFHSSVFAQLADARAAGFTQAQVDAYIKQQMKRDGFIK